MKQTLLTKSLAMNLLFLVLALAFAAPAGARVSQDPAAQAPENEPTRAEDPIRQLNLSPEQRQRIRAITEENRVERQRINRQLREAQFALEQTLDADSPSEAIVEQRIREVADAHAAQIRMRVMQELKIRSVLTSDQVNIWRQLRARNQNLRRRLMNADREVRESRRPFPGQRNTLVPLPPRERRRPRP